MAEEGPKVKEKRAFAERYYITSRIRKADEQGRPFGAVGRVPAHGVKDLPRLPMLDKAAAERDPIGVAFLKAGDPERLRGQTFGREPAKKGGAAAVELLGGPRSMIRKPLISPSQPSASTHSA